MSDPWDAWNPRDLWDNKSAFSACGIYHPHGRVNHCETTYSGILQMGIDNISQNSSPVKSSVPSRQAVATRPKETMRTSVPKYMTGSVIQMPSQSNDPNVGGCINMQNVIDNPAIDVIQINSASALYMLGGADLLCGLPAPSNGYKRYITLSYQQPCSEDSFYLAFGEPTQGANWAPVSTYARLQLAPNYTLMGEDTGQLFPGDSMLLQYFPGAGTLNYPGVWLWIGNYQRQGTSCFSANLVAGSSGTGPGILCPSQLNPEANYQLQGMDSIVATLTSGGIMYSIAFNQYGSGIQLSPPTTWMYVAFFAYSDTFYELPFLRVYDPEGTTYDTDNVTTGTFLSWLIGVGTTVSYTKVYRSCDMSGPGVANSGVRFNLPGLSTLDSDNGVDYATSGIVPLKGYIVE